MAVEHPAALPPPRPWAVALLGAAVVVFVWTLGGLAVANWRLYYANGDLAIYDQATWLIAFGRNPQMSIRGMHVFAHHLNLVLPPVALVYRLWPSPATLLWIQAVAAGLAAVPLFCLARDLLRSDGAALAWAVLFLAYPPLHGLVLSDFHYEVFGIPCLAAALLAVHHRRWGWAVLAVLGALASKEDAGLAVAGFGLGLAVVREQRAGLGLAALGLGWTILATKLVMPRFGSADQAVFYREYFAHLGGSLGQIALSPVLRPGVVLRWLLDPQTGAGPLLCQLLGPLAALSLLRPSWLGGAALLLALNLLSSFWPSRSIFTQYQSFVMPFLAGAAIAGAAQLADGLERRGTRRRVALATPLVAAALGTWLLPVLVPGWFVPPLTSPLRQPAQIADCRAHRPWAAELDRRIAAIPPDAAVAASPSILPKVSARERCWMFPAPFYWSPKSSWRPFPVGDLPPCDQVDAAGLEAVRRTFLDRLATHRVDWLVLRVGPAGGVPLPDPVYAAAIGWIEQSGAYETVFAQDDVRVYRRRS